MTVVVGLLGSGMVPSRWFGMAAETCFGKVVDFDSGCTAG
jgi:hypothetical protein